MQADHLRNEKDLRRLSPASTAGLIVSLILANKLWILDATSMSLYWVARLPSRRPKWRNPLQTAAEQRRGNPPPIPDTTTSVQAHQRINSPFPRRQRKIALSLGLVGALAAPFIFVPRGGLFKYEVLVPLTAQDRADAKALVQSKECRPQGANETFESWFVRDYRCGSAREQLKMNGTLEEHPDALKNLAAIVAVAVMMFASVFALALLIPLLVRGCASLARRYWDWLNV